MRIIRHLCTKIGHHPISAPFRFLSAIKSNKATTPFYTNSKIKPDQQSCPRAEIPNLLLFFLLSILKIPINFIYDTSPFKKEGKKSFKNFTFPPARTIKNCDLLIMLNRASNFNTHIQVYYDKTPT